MNGFIATADADVAASPEQVWEIVTTRASEVMFGSEVVSDWVPGAGIVWRGDWKGTPFEDHGTIIETDPPRKLVLTHFSPLSGEEDQPENHHLLTYALTATGDGTHLHFEQDGNKTAEAAGHSARNWQTMLDTIKRLAEQPAA